ncbi:MAG: hypothetical protein ACREP9_06015 [Candidatus Dormibacteraceae bacterium]
MRRRTFVKLGVASTVAASLGVDAAANIGMPDVKRLQRATARLHSLDQQHGGDTLWQSAVVQARDSVQLLNCGSYTDSVGQQLLGATGELYTCAGWLALDAGQHDIARTCFTDALAMSRQVDSPQIEVRALANLALQSNALSRPREAVRYATGAERAVSAYANSSWLAALPQLRLAIGSSLTGNARDADKAITHARRILERENDGASEEFSFLSHMEIDAVEATSAIELGRPADAERLLVRAIAGYAQQCARNLALYRVRLTRARLDMKAVDGAAEAAHCALDDLCGEVASWRVASELDAVAGRLAAYPTVDGVESFLIRYQEMH